MCNLKRGKKLVEPQDLPNFVQQYWWIVLLVVTRSLALFVSRNLRDPASAHILLHIIGHSKHCDCFALTTLTRLVRAYRS